MCVTSSPSHRISRKAEKKARQFRPGKLLTAEKLLFCFEITPFLFSKIQHEKELQFQELTIKSEELKVDKDQEILALKEQTQRLQGQLNFGRTSYAEFKEKKAAEVQNLQDQVKDLESRVRSSLNLCQ